MKKYRERYYEMNVKNRTLKNLKPLRLRNAFWVVEQRDSHFTLVKVKDEDGSIHWVLQQVDVDYSVIPLPDEDDGL